MQHEGMVHALSEIQRVLKPRAALIDIRPIEARWPVEVVSSAGEFETSRLIDLPEALADDAAANVALEAARSRGWFEEEARDEFAFFYYWDTPSEMKQFIETEWEDIERLAEEDYRRASSRWASAGADARVRIRVRVRITRWRKT